MTIFVLELYLNFLFLANNVHTIFVFNPFVGIWCTWSALPQSLKSLDHSFSAAGAIGVASYACVPSLEEGLIFYSLLLKETASAKAVDNQLLTD